MSEPLTTFDLAQEIPQAEDSRPWRSGLYSKVLVKKDDLRVVLFVMDAGAEIKEHQAPGSITVQVLRGKIRFRTADQECGLAAGQLLTLGRAVKHSVESVESAAFLLTISWPL